MESTIVIKVTHGETLRRFNARVVNGELDLDMDGLRETVFGLFNFPTGADLLLTYIDEDGDAVTLADEEDLLDVMRQSLNPLRITVKLNAEKNGGSYARSSGSSTPMRSPRVHNPLRNLNRSVAEILKSVPEPLGEALTKLSHDMTSKAISAPALTEIVDCFSKIGLYYLNQVTQFSAAAESSAHSGASASTIGASVTSDPHGSKVDEAMSRVLRNAKSEVAKLENNEMISTSKPEVPGTKNSDVYLGDVTRGVEASVPPAPGVSALDGSSGSMNLNDGLHGDNYQFLVPDPDSFSVPVGNKEEQALHVSLGDGKDKLKNKNLGECHLSEKCDAHAFLNVKPSVTIAPRWNEEIKKSSESKSVGIGGFASTSSSDYLKYCTTDPQHADFPGWIGMKSGSGLGSSSMSTFGLKPINECPFSGIPLANDSSVPASQYVPGMVPFKRSYSHDDDIGSVFHRGIRCDGCGVQPITGPRFKSKVKKDYDLCSICIAEMGNEADYFRMDHPATYSHPLSFKRFYDPQPRVHSPMLPRALRAGGIKPSRPKLDSRFIQDINVLDGTIMAPSTPFTKIWRMRNNGTIVWPRGTQLVWIGGDRLSETVSVDVEIAAYGLPVDRELDIAVDFTAPKLPGRYISYWRMALQTGQKFGQRVWVLIQVDASIKDSMREGFEGLNLNLPPVSVDMLGPEIINVNVEPMAEDNVVEPNNSERASEQVEPIVDVHSNKEQELNFPINNSLIVGGGFIPESPSSSVPYPIIDLYEAVPHAPGVPATVMAATSVQPLSSAPSPATGGVQAIAQEEGQTNDVEQTLLRELEEMGFKQVDLNKEILRMNEYDLEQSVDDLCCGVAEWDPILEELQEMGFCDEEMNKRLLKKNNGSIKRVVMDLIAGGKM